MQDTQTRFCRTFIQLLGLLLLFGLSGCGSSTPQATLVTSKDSSAGQNSLDSIGSCPDGVDCAATGRLCDLVSHTCVQCRDNADCSPDQWCSQQLCAPGTVCKTTDDCASQGGVCAIDVGHCVACLADKDCGDAKVCTAHVCRAPAVACQSAGDCKPFAMMCDPASSTCVECSSSGDCNTGRFCVDHLCLKATCAPGSSRCASSIHQLCSTDGASWQDAPCNTEQACIDGTCASKACKGGDSQCVGTDVVVCAADGSAWSKPQACPIGQSCKDSICENQCAAGKQTCGIYSILTCAADGIGQTKQACPSLPSGKPGACAELPSGATCTAIDCKPYMKFCFQNAVFDCGASGDTSLVVDCNKPAPDGSILTCDGGECVAKKCTPFTKVCADVGTVATCKSDGSGYDKAYCSTNFACGDGTCNPVICNPGQKVCDGNGVIVCNESGTSLTSVKDCTATAQFCLKGSCGPQVCQPSSTFCAAGQLATCNGLGNKFSSQACPVGQACQGDSCQPAVCKALELECDGKSVEQCDPYGSSWLPIKDCGSIGKACFAGTCVDTVCQPLAKSCVGDQLAICKGDGTGTTVQSCDDGDACTTDSCDPLKNACSHTGKSCEDNNPCTIDNCLPTSGQCDHPPTLGTACDMDGNICTEDLCQGGSCTPGPGKNCDDKNACTADACGTKDGLCSHEPAPQEGKACGVGGACKLGDCIVQCSQVNLCPAGCACGIKGCDMFGSQTLPLAFGPGDAAGGWNPFHNEWWTSKPYSNQICRFTQEGTPIDCFAGPSGRVAQIQGEANIDVAYIALTTGPGLPDQQNAELMRFSGMKLPPVWNIDLPAGSVSAGVALDATVVVTANGNGNTTQLRRYDKATGQELSPLNFPAVAAGTVLGLAQADGIYYRVTTSGTLQMLDPFTGAIAAQTAVAIAPTFASQLVNSFCLSAGPAGKGVCVPISAGCQ